jgi:acetyl esterase/lipase
LPLVNDLANMCLESVIDIFPRRSIGDALMKRFLQVDDLTDREPWRQLLADNEAPALPHRLPVFLSQGNVDDTVRPDVTLAYMDRLCRAGSPVRMLLMSGVGHAFIARDSAKAALDWIRDRFAGIQPPSNCSG